MSGVRLFAMLLISPILCGVALVRPFLGLLGLVMMYYFRPDHWGPKWFRPQMWVTAAIAIGWLIRTKKIKFPPLMTIAAVIVGLCFLNAAFAVDSREKALETAQTIFKLVVVMLFTVNLVDTPQRLQWFLWANVLGMIWNLKAIFIQGLSASGVSDDRVDVGVGQGGGSNYIAMILTMTLPFLYMRILNGRGWERFGALFLAMLYVIGVVVTGSRGGFLSLGVVSLYLLFRSNRKVLGSVVLAGMLALFMFLIPQESVERFKQGVGAEGQRDSSAQGRIKLWKAAITMWTEHPIIGVGLDNYQLLSPRYVGVFAGKAEIPYQPGMKGRGFVAHSTWFQALAEGGLILSVPFFLLFPVAWVALRRVRRMRLPDAKRRMLTEQALVLEATLIAFIVSSTFGSHFKIDFMWWYLGCVAALRLIAENEARAFALGAARVEDRPRAVRRRPVGAAT